MSPIVRVANRPAFSGTSRFSASIYVAALVRVGPIYQWQGSIVSSTSYAVIPRNKQNNSYVLISHFTTCKHSM